MHDRPDADALLASVRGTLKSMVDELPAARRHDALMMLKALAIVQREAGAASVSTDQLRRLAHGLRDGSLAVGDSAVRGTLCDFVVAKLRVSNPGYLRAMVPDAARGSRQ